MRNVCDVCNVYDVFDVYVYMGITKYVMCV